MSSSQRPLPSAHIGIFDSGVGGLSVLRALLQTCRGASFTYVADTAFAPYGQRSAAEVHARSQRLSQHLLQQGAQCIVIACNTATTQAIAQLREQFPGVPFVGVEPGIKPAAALSRTGRIGVMATPGTLSSQRFRALVTQHASHCEVTPVPCPGLASAIEAGLPNPDVTQLLDTFCQPLREQQVDVVTLGCTHYPFVADEIAARLPAHVHILDTADAVARRTQHILNWHPALAESPHMPPPRLQTTADAATLARHACTLLGGHWTAEHVPL